jgi:hypothetical protein
MTSLISLGFTPASARAFCKFQRYAEWRRDNHLKLRPQKPGIDMFGTGSMAVMKGKLISICVVEESSSLAFSAASHTRYTAIKAVETKAKAATVGSLMTRRWWRSKGRARLHTVIRFDMTREWEMVEVKVEEMEMSSCIIIKNLKKVS